MNVFEVQAPDARRGAHASRCACTAACAASTTGASASTRRRPRPCSSAWPTMAPREMRRAWMTGFGNARLAGRATIELADLPDAGRGARPSASCSERHPPGIARPFPIAGGGENAPHGHTAAYRLTVFRPRRLGGRGYLPDADPGRAGRGPGRHRGRASRPAPPAHRPRARRRRRARRGARGRAGGAGTPARAGGLRGRHQHGRAGGRRLGCRPRRPRDDARELAKADWNDMFQDNPDYADLNYRNKQLSQRFLPGSETGITPGLETMAPPGVVSGQKIKLFFNHLVRADSGERESQHLPLPVSIIATDIGTGERVVLRDGSLTAGHARQHVGAGPDGAAGVPRPQAGGRRPGGQPAHRRGARALRGRGGDRRQRGLAAAERRSRSAACSASPRRWSPCSPSRTCSASLARCGRPTSTSSPIWAASPPAISRAMPRPPSAAAKRPRRWRRACRRWPLDEAALRRAGASAWPCANAPRPPWTR